MPASGGRRRSQKGPASPGQNGQRGWFCNAYQGNRVCGYYNFEHRTQCARCNASKAKSAPPPAGAQQNRGAGLQGQPDGSHSQKSQAAAGQDAELKTAIYDLGKIKSKARDLDLNNPVELGQYNFFQQQMGQLEAKISTIRKELDSTLDVGELAKRCEQRQKAAANA